MTQLRLGRHNDIVGPHAILSPVPCDITRFFPRIDRIFPGEALNPFFGAQDEGFSEFRSR